jgi:hypothetical protein
MNLQEMARQALEWRTYYNQMFSRYKTEIASDIDRQVVEHVSSKVGDMTADLVTVATRKANIVLWQEDIWGAAVTECMSFEGTSLNHQLAETAQAQLWYSTDFVFSDPALMEQAGNPYSVPDGYASSALLVIPNSRQNGDSVEAVWFVHLFNSLHRRAQDGQHRLAYNLPTARIVGAVMPDQPINAASCAYIAGLEFMRLKLATKSPVLLPRNERRLMAKTKQQLPEIAVVHLRQREPSGRHTETEREYHHRWIVKGHWRRLHEPRKKDGAQVTFVDSYVKGKEGAPLLPPRESVYAVVR